MPSGNPGSSEDLGEITWRMGRASTLRLPTVQREYADARVVIDFRAGPDGVGPVMGFDSGDFFPSAALDAAFCATEPAETPGTAVAR